MKSMKKIISVLLMVCVFASILSVSAFAVVNAVTVTTNKSVYSSNENVTVEVRVTDNLSDFAGHTVEYYVNNVRHGYTKTTDGNGYAAATFTANELLALVGAGSGFNQAYLNIKAVVTHRNGESEGKVESIPVAVTVNEYIAPMLITVNPVNGGPGLEGVGSTCGLQAVVTPAGASQSVTWDCSDPSVVAVVPNGASAATVTALKEGTVTIIATSEVDANVSGTYTMVVSIPATSVDILENSLSFTSIGATQALTTYVDPAAASPAAKAITWSCENNGVVTVDANGNVTSIGVGTAWVKAALTANPSIYDQINVSVTDPGAASVSINPAPHVDMSVGEQVIFTASTNDATFAYWIAEPAGYVTLSPSTTSPTVTVTANQMTGLQDVKIIAYAKKNVGSDYVRAETTVKITQADALQLQANPERITSGNSSTVSVVNPTSGERFQWFYQVSGQNVATVQSYADASYVTVKAGSADGSVTITAKSINNPARTAQITVYVNSAAPYGSASVSPSSANWARNGGNLTFIIEPGLYSAYLDNTLLNNLGTAYATYYNGVLTLKAAYLNTLSSGAHSLKIYTSSGNSAISQPDGLVYATIYIDGSASNYGDSVHVKGSAYNLYFTATDPIEEVYISNTYIAPNNYALDASGKQLTLYSGFLNQLAYGSYTVQLKTQNGYTETAQFRIVAANYAPATGDNNNILAWMAALAISGAGVIALIPRKKEQM